MSKVSTFRPTFSVTERVKAMVVTGDRDTCGHCGREPHRTRDGLTYLYRYRIGAPIVCSKKCDRAITENVADLKRRVAAAEGHALLTPQGE